MTSRPDIFLSYSREDLPVARQYAQALRQEGYEVWWDQALATGQAFEEVTEQALEHARAVVVLWSRTSVSSRWVRAEATQADQAAKLMPVMIEACKRPIKFELTQTADLSHWKGDAADPAWKSFIGDLHRLAPLDPAQRSAAPGDLSALPATQAARTRHRRWLPWVVAAAVLAAVAAGAMGWQRSAQLQGARAAVPEITALVDQGKIEEAFAKAQDIRRFLPDDPLLQSITPLFTRTYSVSSDPEGADVYVRSYDSRGEWRHLGKTPIARVDLPRKAQRWRAEKAGFATVELSNASLGPDTTLDANQYLKEKPSVLAIQLTPEAQLPTGMVLVPKGDTPLGVPIVAPASLPSFYIDREEVTNEAYKEFVDAGGYERKALWDGLGIHDKGRALTFEQSRALFVDSTGRAGPANWELGTYPAGKGRYPVTGISWYEASAYARFRGKLLPPAGHWMRASLPPLEATNSLAASITPFSNFGTPGPAEVASFQGLGPYGTYDTFGNVSEWVANTGGETGWVAGGSWEDPQYYFATLVPVPLVERRRQTGMRLMKPAETAPMDAAWLAPIDDSGTRKDILGAKPAPDDVYALYARQFDYRPGPLNASAPVTLATTEDWIKQRVTIDTGYDGKRMDVYLFVPRHGNPPFQAIFLFSGAHIFLLPGSSEAIEPGIPAMPLDFVVKSGRMLVQPVLEGSYERFQAPINLADQVRSMREFVSWRWDVGRTLDYLESRADVNAGAIGYVGLSFGSSFAMPIIATEPRFKAAVLVSGGIPPQKIASNLDAIHYAPRVRIPVLMINGRFDNLMPVEGNQLPLYRLLGSPSDQKRHLVLDYGHGSPPRAELLRETLGWYDRYLGPVGR